MISFKNYQFTILILRMFEFYFPLSIFILCFNDIKLSIMKVLLLRSFTIWLEAQEQRIHLIELEIGLFFILCTWRKEISHLFVGLLFLQLAGSGPLRSGLSSHKEYLSNTLQPYIYGMTVLSEMKQNENGHL